MAAGDSFSTFGPTLGDVVLNLWALIRSRWALGLWLAQITLELVGAVALYFVLFTPLVKRLAQTAPELVERLRLDQLPAWMTVSIVVIIVLVSGTKLIRLWQYRQGAKT